MICANPPPGGNGLGQALMHTLRASVERQGERGEI